ncbi:hypothetical protein GCM10028791_33200 [Echinicola sediminis]
MKLEEYRNRKENPFYNYDSIGYSLVEGDTIVKLNRTKKNPGDWVSVPYEPKEDDFLETYKKIVFNLGDSAYQHQATIRYWKAPIKIFFDPSVNRSSQVDLMKFAEKIAHEVDSLKIEFVNTAEKANYFIYFQSENISPEVFDEKLSYKNDGYYLYWNGAKQFKSCYLKLNPTAYRKKSRQKKLLRQRFIQTLGFFYLQDDFPCNSFFAKCSKSKPRLTKEDLALLRYHYSYGICKGTDLIEFEDQHKRAREIISRGTKSSMNFIHPR